MSIFFGTLYTGCPLNTCDLFKIILIQIVDKKGDEVHSFLQFFIYIQRI